jgi:hypothetical protein
MARPPEGRRPLVEDAGRPPLRNGPRRGREDRRGACDGATVAYARDESDRIVSDPEPPDRTPIAEGQATYDLRKHWRLTAHTTCGPARRYR